MKISIRNFKSIRALDNFEIRPFTVISGINSSGKSSLIQLLLLLKQTIKTGSISDPLIKAGPFYKARKYEEFIFEKNGVNKLEISFRLNRDELSSLRKADRYKDLLTFYEDYDCCLTVKYDFTKDVASITEFRLEFNFFDEDAGSHFFQINHDGEYSISTDISVFDDQIFYEAGKFRVTDVLFSSIFPLQYSAIPLAEIKGDEAEAITRQNVLHISPVTDIISDFFKAVSYIGPLRIKPEEIYLIEDQHSSVGISGEYTAQVLENYKSKAIYFNKLVDDGGSFKRTKGTLLRGVKYWMCEVFGLGKDIYAREKNETYQIFIENHLGLLVTINHVGFGISQVLPIVVEGLMLPKDGILIIEEPESHLHPRLQSLLFDFLYSLTLLGKTIIIESHSDHLITRMRRRVAEDSTNLMANKINLSFVKAVKGISDFKPLALDEFGGLDYFPEDFIEVTSAELSAIVKAQMTKRLAKKS